MCTPSPPSSTSTLNFLPTCFTALCAAPALLIPALPKPCSLHLGMPPPLLLVHQAKPNPPPLLPLSPASQAGQEGSEGGRGEDQLLSVQCSKCLRASTGMWHQNVCHSLKIRNILSSSAGDRNKVLKVAPTKEHVLSETCGSTAGGGGGSVFDCFCSRNCSWPNSHNPPWPFPPTYPSNTLEQWRIDRRKLQPCLEFTTIPS